MKKRVISAATLLVLVAVGSASAAAPTNLVNYYSFNSQTLLDESAKYNQNVGVSATDLTMVDPSGLGTNYKPGIGSKYDVAETGDYAIWVSGNYHNYTGVEQLKFPNGDADIALGTNMTIEMWVHSGGQEANWGGATNGTFMASNNFSVGYAGFPGGTLNMNVAVTGGASNNGATWTLDTWHHFALVCDGATATYYFDGVAVGSPSTISGWTTTTAISFGAAAIGRQTGAAAIDAWIDDLAMWNTALDASTIAAHAVSGGLGLTMGTPPATHHAGDANEDGAVDLQDFGLLKENFGIVTGAVWGQGDFNNDGGIDLQDFGILKDHFGHTNGSSPITAVPEPATMSLLALAGLGLLRKRTR